MYVMDFFLHSQRTYFSQLICLFQPRAYVHAHTLTRREILTRTLELYHVTKSSIFSDKIGWKTLEVCPSFLPREI